ncbi:hypothetical protein [Halomonas saccharevitans]|uniref:DNA polymerase V n=1 Tax=Halomonas saccharevitans TaxID=416872 RepID=A0A1I7CAZ1_9GAMM|nr:hypothetical protein [Halomonas saccharevitans]SFT96568.1 hypothetical protein SAMN04487956_13942 [Halomonas saccharevitans]
MKVNYLGPCLAVDHPALAELDHEPLPVSCYLVELSEEAGVEGPLIEGDVLVVDEARPVQHGDLVVVETGEGLGLFKSHRIGGRFRLLPASGGEGRGADPEVCRGVVVRKARMPVR